MKIKSLIFAGTLAALIAMSGCGAQPAGSNPANSDGSEISQPESSALPSTESLNDEGYEISTDGIWQAYVSNRDNYKLHVRKADGTEDKVIVDDGISLFPCLVGEWVYYFPDLSEIDKIRLDGTGQTKVCDTDAIENLNGSMAVTTEYKDGSILYRTQQMQEGGDDTSYPENDYKLDLEQEKITPVGN